MIHATRDLGPTNVTGNHDGPERKPPRGVLFAIMPPLTANFAGTRCARGIVREHMNLVGPFKSLLRCAITGPKMPAIVLAVALASQAVARPSFLDRFNLLYKPQAGSDLAKAECKTCHSIEHGPPDRNPFGTTLEGLIDPLHSDIGVTRDDLIFIEKEDSDGDGYSNLEEIVSGTLPGDKSSHPSSHPTNLPKHEMSRKIVPLHLEVTGGVLLLGILLGGGGKAAKKASMSKLGAGVGALGILAALGTFAVWFFSNRHP